MYSFRINFFLIILKKTKTIEGGGGGEGAWVFRSTGGMGRDPKNRRGLSYLNFQKFSEIGVINWKQNSQTNFNMQMWNEPYKLKKKQK